MKKDETWKEKEKKNLLQCFHLFDFVQLMTNHLLSGVATADSGL